MFSLSIDECDYVITLGDFTIIKVHTHIKRAYLHNQWLEEL